MWLLYRVQAENANLGQIERENGGINAGLAMIQDNSLLPISSPYIPSVEVLASIIIDCESKGKHEGVWGKAGEYGSCQFLESTFYWMASQANIQNPDWKNQSQQEQLLRWAIINDIAQYHWSCYPKGRQE